LRRDHRLVRGGVDRVAGRLEHEGHGDGALRGHDALRGRDGGRPVGDLRGGEAVVHGRVRLVGDGERELRGLAGARRGGAHRRVQRERAGGHDVHGHVHGGDVDLARGAELDVARGHVHAAAAAARRGRDGERDGAVVERGQREGLRGGLHVPAVGVGRGVAVDGGGQRDGGGRAAVVVDVDGGGASVHG